MTDDPLTECPVCAGKVRRVVNSVGVVFKGKGFYVTDNRSSNRVSAANSKKEKTSENGSGSGESKSGESKSAKSEKAAKPA